MYLRKIIQNKEILYYYMNNLMLILMAYDMPYGHRTYYFRYTMLCLGPHFNCIHDTRRGRTRCRREPHEPAGRHLPIPDLTY